MKFLSWALAIVGIVFFIVFLPVRLWIILIIVSFCFGIWKWYGIWKRKRATKKAQDEESTAKEGKL